MTSHWSWPGAELDRLGEVDVGWSTAVLDMLAGVRLVTGVAWEQR